MGGCLKNVENEWFWLKHLGVRIRGLVSGLGFESTFNFGIRFGFRFWVYVLGLVLGLRC